MCLAVPGKIISIDRQESFLTTARVSFGGIVKQVSLAYVPEAKIDDYVIVHAGFALNVIDQTEAELTLNYLQQINSRGID